MPRLFVAIDLPDDLVDAFSTLEDASLDARWTPPEQFHLTLRFIGAVDEDKAQVIAEKLSQIDSPPFEVSGEGLDVFPSRRRPRVLVARIHATPPLTSLQSRIDEKLLELGIEQDRKPFNPHVTFARPKASPREVRVYMKKHLDFQFAPFVVERFHLYKSDLGPSGAVHTVLRSYELAG